MASKVVHVRLLVLSNNRTEGHGLRDVLEGSE